MDINFISDKFLAPGIKGAKFSQSSDLEEIGDSNTDIEIDRENFFYGEDVAHYFQKSLEQRGFPCIILQEDWGWAVSSKRLLEKVKSDTRWILCIYLDEQEAQSMSADMPADISAETLLGRAGAKWDIHVVFEERKSGFLFDKWIEASEGSEKRQQFIGVIDKIAQEINT